MIQPIFFKKKKNNEPKSECPSDIVAPTQVTKLSCLYNDFKVLLGG